MTGRLAVLAWLLAGCQGAPVTEQILITSDPPGAACTMDRDGVRLGSIAATPAPIAFPAKGGALTATCTKPGFTSATEERTPGYSPDRGNLGPGGLVFLAVRMAAPPPPKSDWHYPAEIHVDLPRMGQPVSLLPLSGLRLH